MQDNLGQNFIYASIKNLTLLSLKIKVTSP